MESSQKQLEAKLNSFGQALHSLENALNQPYSEFLRDSVIQRFEYTWELTWKCCQALSRKAGQSADSPRAAIRFVYAQKLINVDEVDFWFEAIDMRNLAAHTYKESLAVKVYEYAKNFAPKAKTLLEMLILESNKK